MLNKLLKLSTFLGINLKTGYNNLKNLSWYFKDYKNLKSQLKEDKNFPFGKWYPMLNDKHAESGSASGAYFHQDLLVAQKVYINNPKKHIDIGSSVSGLVAHIASYREIEVFDIRPLSSNIDNIKFIKADFMAIDDHLHNYCDSLSCLHVIEHFGLGRYNDPINANGHLIGLENIYKIIKPGGKFYFSTPIGPQRIEFNAHRVFNLTYLIDILKDKYTIDSFSYVDDSGDLHPNIDILSKNATNNFGCTYGCGIFELTKL